MLGISKNFLLTFSFVVHCSLTSDLLMSNMRQILGCRNTSSLFRRDIQSSQLSHPHSNKLIGMARKMSYLLQFSMLASVYNLARDCIDTFPNAGHASIF